MNFRPLFLLFAIFLTTPRAVASDGVPFWVDSDNVVLGDFLKTRLTAHGFREHSAHCAVIIVEAKERVTATAEGYRINVRVTFLSMDGTPVGQWKSDPEQGLLGETTEYRKVLERLFEERSNFAFIAEGVAMSLPILLIPSRICGSG